jgi:hypothetical protein
MLKRWGLLLILAMLAGCTNAAPTTNPDGPILTGFDALPKSLATVFLSPTPNMPQAQATLDSNRPTPTLPPPTFTATPTPYVGIFMGNPTFSALGIFPTGTRAVLVITVPPQTATRAAILAATAAAANPVNPGSTAVAVNPGVSGVPLTCSVQPAGPFINASKNVAVQQKLGCPTGEPFNVTLVAQPFQTGFMIWRDTKQIYAISTAGLQKGAATDTFWRVPDNWNESLPADDPSQVPPGGLLQPIRGFGYAWRSNTTIRNSLGWALATEVPYQSTWQDFQNGWMMTDNNGSVLALSPLDGAGTTGIHFGAMSQ